VYGIVKQSGGEIEVTSKLAVGTTFSVYLPRYEQPPEPAECEDEGVKLADLAAGAPTRTLLVVEDERGVRDLATAVLKAAGHTVLAAGHGREALEVCATHEGPIDLLLTDVVMPGMSGIELSERLVALRPATKVLYMSGFTDDVTLKHGVETASTAFLQKPFTTAGLARKVREVLDGAR
jgi:CheY-like chemotaxis protein